MTPLPTTNLTYLEHVLDLGKRVRAGGGISTHLECLVLSLSISSISASLHRALPTNAERCGKRVFLISYNNKNDFLTHECDGLSSLPVHEGIDLKGKSLGMSATRVFEISISRSLPLRYVLWPRHTHLHVDQGAHGVLFPSSFAYTFLYAIFSHLLGLVNPRSLRLLPSWLSIKRCSYPSLPYPRVCHFSFTCLRGRHGGTSDEQSAKARVESPNSCALQKCKTIYITLW